MINQIRVNAEVKEEARRIIRETLTLIGAREAQFVELCLLESRLAQMKLLELETITDEDEEMSNPDYCDLENEIIARRNVLRGQ